MDSSSLLSSATLSPRDLVAPQAGLDKPTDEQAAQMFEGLILTQMFQSMRSTVPHSNLFGENAQARTSYEYLLDQAVVEHAMAAGKGLGLAASLAKNIKQ